MGDGYRRRRSGGLFFHLQYAHINQVYAKSLQVEESPIGHIARSLALVGAGKNEDALDDFDLVFRDCDPSDNMLLLVIKVRV